MSHDSTVLNYWASASSKLPQSSMNVSIVGHQSSSVTLDYQPQCEHAFSFVAVVSTNFYESVFI